MMVQTARSSVAQRCVPNWPARPLYDVRTGSSAVSASAHLTAVVVIERPVPYTFNDLYSVATLTNSTGNVVERIKYQPFGQATVLEPDGITVRAASAYGNTYQWQGGRLDAGTGLNYKRQRMYSSDLGRFTSRWPDAVADPNFYEFQFNRPTYMLDPKGDPGPGVVVGLAAVAVLAVLGYEIWTWDDPLPPVGPITPPTPPNPPSPPGIPPVKPPLKGFEFVEDWQSCFNQHKAAGKTDEQAAEICGRVPLKYLKEEVSTPPTPPVPQPCPQNCLTESGWNQETAAGKWSGRWRQTMTGTLPERGFVDCCCLEALGSTRNPTVRSTMFTAREEGRTVKDACQAKCR